MRHRAGSGEAVVSKNISTPICDFIRDYADSGISRFHMPGHKGADIMPLSYTYDITEVTGADSLYEATGIIAQSEQNASHLFGSGATFYSVEGSSHCIRAMLALAAQCPGAGSSGTASHPVILAARNIHRSFLTAAALLDLDVAWLYPAFSYEGSYCTCPVTAEQIRRRLDAMDPLPAAVYLTSPDYLGHMQDIASIADVVHAYKIPLLVDNAHGAYLHFLEQPMHPVDLGADMCCDSAHKTLPAMTGCAYLHISRSAAPRYAAFARNALALFGSTSPSYLLMASLDQTNQILAGDFPKRLQTACNAATHLRSLFEADSPAPATCLTEPLKITLRSRTFGMTGTDLADALRMQKIECEYADTDCLVLMLSPCNTDRDLSRLHRALEQLAAQGAALVADPCSMPGSAGICTSDISEPQRILSIRDACFSASERLPVEEAAGRICADPALACPPGIPIVICGEIITPQAVRILKHYGRTHISVIASKGQRCGYFPA